MKPSSETSSTNDPATGRSRPAPWLALDRRLFSALGGGHSAKPSVLRIARLVADGSWLPLLGLMGTALASYGLRAGGLLLAQTLVLAGLVQLASKRLARRWRFDRPFMLGLSPNHLQHSTRAGFPSTHATVMAFVVGFLGPQMPPDWPLAGMVAVVLATGWARIYTGAHFPLDVMAGTAVGLVLGVGLSCLPLF